MKEKSTNQEKKMSNKQIFTNKTEVKTKIGLRF